MVFSSTTHTFKFRFIFAFCAQARNDSNLIFCFISSMCFVLLDFLFPLIAFIAPTSFAICRLHIYDPGPIYLIDPRIALVHRTYLCFFAENTVLYCNPPLQFNLILMFVDEDAQRPTRFVHRQMCLHFLYIQTLAVNSDRM